MLVQFLVENFRSFKDETVFSMRAPPGETRAVATIPGHDGLRLMRAAAFYGANASGKSNFVQAIDIACGLIANGGTPNASLPARPFHLAPDARLRTTRFQFDFLSDGVLYSHVLLITAEAVTGEALYRTLPGTSDEELVFEREAPADGGEHRVEFGPMVLSGNAEQQQFARFVAKGTPAYQPLLTELVTRNVPGFAAIHAWFQQDLTVVTPTTRCTNLAFPLTDESDGTQRLLHLLPVLFHGPQESCTVIDELDRSLHTSLTRRFVEEFMAMASDAPSQLIFTTHDTNLLNGRLLPPGSIWFVEKDDDGASHLHSLADYRAAQLEHLLEHLEEGYLQGRFGAIPFRGDRQEQTSRVRG